MRLSASPNPKTNFLMIVKAMTKNILKSRGAINYFTAISGESREILS